MFRSRKKKNNGGNKRTVRSTLGDDDDNDGENDQNLAATTGVRKDNDDDEEEEEDKAPSALLIALQKRKKDKKIKKKTNAKRKLGGGGGLIVRSFDVEEAGEDDNSATDEDNHNRRKKKKKRKRGLGFGGGVATTWFDGDSKQNGDDDDRASRAIHGAYGKEALEQLKSEQKRQSVQQDPPQTTTIPAFVPLNDGDLNATGNSNNGGLPQEESFISLEDPGEENGGGWEHHGQIREQEKDSVFVVENPPPDESHGWERQIEQRAGIKVSSRRSPPTNNTVLSLDELSQKLKSTIDIIDRQREELENSTNRLKVDRDHAAKNAEAHNESIKNTGLACEFYQATRRDLTLWVGALRDFQEKVQPIAAAFREMLEVQSMEYSREFRSWQDDCIAALYQTDRLDRVLGRQPDSTLLTKASNEVVYDEFGRDIRSQYLRDRELRFKERLAYIHRNNTDSNDVIRREDHDEEERSKILHEALNAAIEDLNEEYTSVKKLKAVFDGWFAAYYYDYQQCYATLSFGDLYAVLVQVQICKSNFFPDVLSSGSDGSKISATNSDVSPPYSILEINECSLDASNDRNLNKEGKIDPKKLEKSTTENRKRIARAVEKGVFPMLVEMLKNDADRDEDDSSFFLFSSPEKSSLIAGFIRDVAIRPLQSNSSESSSSNLLQKVRDLVSITIKNALDGVAIPLLNKQSGGPVRDDERNSGSSLPPQTKKTDCSVVFASFHLVRILQQTLCNIIVHWFPLMARYDTEAENGEAESGIHHLLNFVNNKYLVLLSSIENTGDRSSSSENGQLTWEEFFKPVWEALNREPTNIIESPSLMLLTMPLRAAAHAYNLN